MVETVAQRQIVAQACLRAREAGIRPGIALSAARAALGPGVIVEPHDPHRTARALRAFGLWCHRFSPVVAIEDAEGVCLDITGCAHLFGGEGPMLERVQADAQRLGIETRAAITPTFAAARALARWGDSDGLIIQRSALCDSVCNLPVRALGIDADAIDGLAEVNISRIGSLIDLPRAAVAARFGETVLASLDRMLGRAPDLIDSLRPVERLRVERVFDGPCVCLEAIGLACRELLDRLGAHLAAREAGVTEWSVVLGRSDMDPLMLTIRHCAPSREARHLWRLLAPRLERAHLGFGVESVAAVAVCTKRIRHHQPGWWETIAEGMPGSSDADALIDALANRLGEEAVLYAELRHSRVPERAFVLRSALHRGEWTVPFELVEGDRPTRLLDPPQPARVISLSPDGPVSHLEWSGGAHRIVSSIGPERIKGEWWLGDRFERDYFRVQDEHGVWRWIFRDAPGGRWLVHGVWE